MLNVIKIVGISKNISIILCEQFGTIQGTFKSSFQHFNLLKTSFGQYGVARPGGINKVMTSQVLQKVSKADKSRVEPSVRARG